MPGGRPPKPTALHKLHGTYNVTEHRGRALEPVAIGELCEPPPDLTDAQQDIWRYAIEHAPRDVLKMIDRDVFKSWVDAVDRRNIAMAMQAMIDRDTKLKLLIKGPLGLIPSPYNDILDKTTKAIRQLAGDLGFSPAARPRLQVQAPRAGQEAPPDRWGALHVIKGGKGAADGSGNS